MNEAEEWLDSRGGELAVNLVIAVIGIGVMVSVVWSFDGWARWVAGGAAVAIVAAVVVWIVRSLR